MRADRMGSKLAWGASMGASAGVLRRTRCSAGTATAKGTHRAANRTACRMVSASALRAAFFFQLGTPARERCRTCNGRGQVRSQSAGVRNMHRLCIRTAARTGMPCTLGAAAAWVEGVPTTLSRRGMADAPVHALMPRERAGAGTARGTVPRSSACLAPRATTFRAMAVQGRGGWRLTTHAGQTRMRWGMLICATVPVSQGCSLCMRHHRHANTVVVGQVLGWWPSLTARTFPYPPCSR